jgi:hypothetical protein
MQEMWLLSLAVAGEPEAGGFGLGVKPEGELPRLQEAPVISCCLSREVIRRGLRLEGVSACYEAALERGALEGRATLGFSIAHEDGRVSGVSLSPELEPEFAACMVAEVQTWVFFEGQPVCSGRGSSEIRYPLVFSSE